VDIGDLDIAGTSVARQNDGEVAAWNRPSKVSKRTCWKSCTSATPPPELAARLQTSHTAIAHRLRKYGIPNKA
jgi:transcriptional regulator of aromatic amino acid metabolism